MTNRVFLIVSKVSKEIRDISLYLNNWRLYLALFVFIDFRRRSCVINIVTRCNTLPFRSDIHPSERLTWKKVKWIINRKKLISWHSLVLVLILIWLVHISLTETFHRFILLCLSHLNDYLFQNECEYNSHWYPDTSHEFYDFIVKFFSYRLVALNFLDFWSFFKRRLHLVS